MVYFHSQPGRTTEFAVGSPRDCQADGNKLASDMLGKTTTFGHVYVYHKNKLKDSKRERAEKKAARPRVK
jgi:hypothetical protein